MLSGGILFKQHRVYSVSRKDFQGYGMPQEDTTRISYLEVKNHHSKCHEYHKLRLHWATVCKLWGLTLGFDNVHAVIPTLHFWYTQAYLCVGGHIFLHHWNGHVNMAN